MLLVAQCEMGGSWAMDAKAKLLNRIMSRIPFFIALFIGDTFLQVDFFRFNRRN